MWHLPDAFDDNQAVIFQQDGAPPHKAKSVSEWLDGCGIEYIKDWPKRKFVGNSET